MSKTMKSDKKKKEIESKPARFKQDKSEFNRIYNQVKDFAREHSKGIARTQMNNELRKRLGLEPKVVNHSYRVMQERNKKAKEYAKINKERAFEEKLVFANSLLPTKQKKKREK